MNVSHIHSPLAKWAVEQPHKDAVRIGGTALSYAALHERTLAVAHQLADLGIGPGDKVGIFMPKCLELPVAVYGILHAGACYVPLDPNAPAARVAQMMTDCGITTLLTVPAKAVALQAIAPKVPRLKTVIGAPLVSLENIASSGFAEPGDARSIALPVPSDEDPCYVLFTSGSTGVPKGMVHSHGSARSYVHMAADLYEIKAEDRLANHAPLHFDLSKMDFFASLLRGATVVLVPDVVTKLPAEMSKLIQNEQITVWYSVPFALIQLEEHGVLEQRDFSQLRLMIFAGSPMPPGHLNALQKRLRHVRFSNAYGPAEANAVTAYHLPPEPHLKTEPVPIGFATPNAQIHLSEEGELWVASDALMLGYHNRDDLNEDAFVRLEGTRFYKSGDIVRQDATGCFHYIGRRDRQVKLRGQRIELDEVELALGTFTGVSEVAVVQSADGHALIAFVTCAPGKPARVEDLTNHARRFLPAVAVPTTIHVVDGFERTSTGKIDRKQLDITA
ncbi:MAG: amino acid adenylation domain-containing protein [Pseudomonadota bacterium]